MLERAIKNREEQISFMKSQLAKDTRSLKKAIQRQIIGKQEEIPVLQKELMTCAPELRQDYRLRIERRKEEIQILEKRLEAIPDKDEIKRRMRLLKDEIKLLKKGKKFLRA